MSQPTRWLDGLALALILVFYGVMGLGYALGTPPWEAPDEPAHYNYIKYLAENGRLPVLQVGDYDFAELERLKAARFPPSMSIDGMRYEFHQPPFYYLLLSPLYRASAGLSLPRQVLFLRLASVVLGTMLLLVIYRITRTFFPEERLLPLGVPALIAVIPMHTAISAAINNDTLSELLLALLLWLALLRLEERITPRKYILLGGLTFGLGLLTKVTVYVGIILLLAVEAIALWTGWRASRRLVWERVRDFILLVCLALVIAGWWFVRNALVYGQWDVFGLKRHDLVVIGQPRTVPGWEAIYHFVTVTFRSFWAQFGWMGILIDERLYHSLALLTSLAVIGLMIAWAKRGFVLSAPYALLVLHFILILGGLIHYNLTYIQAQGRYLYPAAVAIATGMIIGWREITRHGRLFLLLLALGILWLAWQGAGRAFLPLGLALLLAAGAVWRYRPAWLWPGFLILVLTALAALEVYCLVGVIIPYFR